MSKACWPSVQLRLCCDATCGHRECESIVSPERVVSGARRMKYIGLGLIRLYQVTLSRVLPPSCRFEPSCSRYTYIAIDKYGLLRGSWMGFKRILRCNPFNPGGYDPVP